MFRSVTMRSVFAVACLSCMQATAAYNTDRDDGYGPPEPAYEEPAQEYGAPVPAYGATAAAATPDLTPIIIGILVLTGLSLLFPTYVTLTSVRRKRDAEVSQDSTSNLVERVQDIYMAVMESEECMERIACEVGGIAADAGINKGMIKMAQSFVPKKYSKMMKNFNSAKDCHKIKCGAF